MKKVSTFVGSVLVVFVGPIMCGMLHAQAPEEGAPPAAESTSPHTSEKSLLGNSVAVPVNKSSDLCRCVGESSSASVDKIKQALEGPLHSAGLDFSEQPLADVVNQLQEEYGIPIKLNARALDEIGVRTDEAVTIHAKNISLRAGLRMMMQNLSLTYVIQDEVLMITTEDEAEKILVTCVYDVRDLAAAYKQKDPQGASAHADYNPLIGAITECIAKDTWHENGGGDAEIRPLQPGLLVISQTPAIHEQIRELLSAVRSIGIDATKQSSISSEKPTANIASARREVETRSYSLQLNEGDVNAMRSQVRELLTAALPDEVWHGRLPDGQGVALTVFADRVVLRQRPEVQEKVAKIFADSGIATPSPRTARTEGAPGGFGQMQGRGFGEGMAGGEMGMADGASGMIGPGNAPRGMGRGGRGFGDRPLGLPAPAGPEADNPFNE